MSSYLIDTSVWHRADLFPHHLAELGAAAALATCGAVDLELGYSMRGASDHARLAAARLGLPRAEVSEEVMRRALEVQGLLARRGWQRMAPMDLIIAAAAEQAGMTMLHYDSDFERIAEVTGQPHRWIAPRGTL